MREELLTIATAALPISELRGAIPLGLSFGFSPLKTYLLSVFGNGIIIAPLLLFLYYGSAWAMREIRWCERLLTWLFERTRKRHASKMAHISFIALAIFVAVPLPMTGAWTATIIAFLLEMSIWRAFTAILMGVLVAGVIVLTVSMGVITIL